MCRPTLDELIVAGERRTPSSRCISANDSRPVRSTASSAARSATWSGYNSRRTPLACSVITLMLCAVRSCSSRAIRSRSSVTAAAARHCASARPGERAPPTAPLAGRGCRSPARPARHHPEDQPGVRDVGDDEALLHHDAQRHQCQRDGQREERAPAVIAGRHEDAEQRHQPAEGRGRIHPSAPGTTAIAVTQTVTVLNGAIRCQAAAIVPIPYATASTAREVPGSGPSQSSSCVARVKTRPRPGPPGAAPIQACHQPRAATAHRVRRGGIRAARVIPEMDPETPGLPMPPSGPNINVVSGRRSAGNSTTGGFWSTLTTPNDRPPGSGAMPRPRARRLPGPARR